MTDLTPALVRKHQVEPGWWFGVRHTTQWRDTDGYGHINHRAYLAWFEEARNRYLEAVGLPRLAIDQPSTTRCQATSSFTSYGDGQIYERYDDRPNRARGPQK